MARRKKRFGAVATRPGRGPQYHPRRFSVAVSVMRKGKSYMSVACPKFTPSSRRPTSMRSALNRCGNSEGRTPTEAVKGALSALARKLK